MNPGIYRHFKGGLYEVLMTATRSEDDHRTVVVYRSLADGKTWTRQLHHDDLVDAWEDLVRWPDGEIRQRFVLEVPPSVCTAPSADQVSKGGTNMRAAGEKPDSVEACTRCVAEICSEHKPHEGDESDTTGPGGAVQPSGHRTGARVISGSTFGIDDGSAGRPRLEKSAVPCPSGAVTMMAIGESGYHEPCIQGQLNEAAFSENVLGIAPDGQPVPQRSNEAPPAKIDVNAFVHRCVRVYGMDRSDVLPIVDELLELRRSRTETAGPAIDPRMLKLLIQRVGGFVTMTEHDLQRADRFQLRKVDNGHTISVSVVEDT